MIKNKLLTLILTTAAFINVQSAHATLADCTVGDWNGDMGSIHCKSEGTGGLITVKNISKTTNQAVYLYPNYAYIPSSTVVLKPGEVSDAYFMTMGSQLKCRQCTLNNVAITITKQCSHDRTEDEYMHGTCH